MNYITVYRIFAQFLSCFSDRVSDCQVRFFTASDICVLMKEKNIIKQQKEREKIDYGLILLKTQDRLPQKFVKHIKDGIYELRTEYNGNIYRTFFIFDKDQIIVLFNGFQKKTQKTPKNEIEKAIKIKNEYYEYKKQFDPGL